MTRSRTIQTRGLYSEFSRKGGSAPRATHYCAGCGHGVLHKLIGEAIADLGIRQRTVVLSPVGCAVFGYYYFDCGNVQVAHGRAPAVGTGLARAVPGTVVISYQGDGDLCSIGFNQTFQAANRGEPLAVFFVNNAVYGMTGGQMAPTTLVGQCTTTSPRGRTVANDGYPVHACEVLERLQAPVYIERCSLADSQRIQRSRQAVRKALEIQKRGAGYAFVEFLSPCPTNMRKGGVGTAQFMIDEMEREFPLKCFRDRSAEATGHEMPVPGFDKAMLDDVLQAGNSITDAVSPEDDFPLQRTKIAGFGGQGVLSLGMMIAVAGQHAGHRVTWFPSYGPEQRGGTANCSVVVSGREIGSPVVSTIDTLIALNQPSLTRFAGDVRPGGTILYDASVASAALPAGVRALAVPAFEMATGQGVAKAANTAMLGALAACGVSELPEAAFAGVLSEVFASKPATLSKNRDVFDLAFAWAQAHPLSLS